MDKRRTNGAVRLHLGPIAVENACLTCLREGRAPILTFRWYWLLVGSVGAGSIPEELGGLTKLEKLILNDNRLTGKGRIPWMLGLECVVSLAHDELDR